MRKISKLLAGAVFALALVGCPTNPDTPSNGGSSNGGGDNQKAISGLNANKLLNGYIGDVQYSIVLNAEAATFIATPTLGRGDSDAKTLTGTFVCDKVTDDLFWYGKNTNVCLKVDGTDKCCKIAADFTNPDSDATSSTAKGVTVNKYHTSDMTKTEFTATQKAVESKPADKPVTLTEEQKNCLKKAETELKKCSKITVSDLTQDFTVKSSSGSPNSKKCTVGFDFNIDGTACSVYIDKETVKICADESKDFSSTTPSWLQSAVNTIISTDADPSSYLTGSEYSCLKDVASQLVTTVASSNDDVIYTEDYKQNGYDVPCPWSDTEIAKLKKFTDIYFISEPAPTGAIYKSYLFPGKFIDDEIYKIDSNGNRVTSEAIFLFGYGFVDPVTVHGNQFDKLGEEHVFGVKVKINLQQAQKEINKRKDLSNSYSDDSTQIYSMFSIESVDAQEGVYEATPEWFYDAVSTFISPSHTDYDRQYYIKNENNVPINYIKDVWLDYIYYEILYPNSYDIQNEAYADVYTRTGTEESDTYEGPVNMSCTDIKKKMGTSTQFDYFAYTEPVKTTTDMAEYKLERYEIDFNYEMEEIGKDPNYEYSYIKKYDFGKNIYLFPLN